MFLVGMNPKILARFLNHTYCHQCGAILKEAEVTLLFESPVVSVAHIQCAGCGGETLATLSIGGCSVTDVRTDLSPSEVRRFFNAPSVSVDDVLDLHELLQKGEVWQVLEREEEKSWGKKSKRSAKRVVSQPFSLSKDKPLSHSP